MTFLIGQDMGDTLAALPVVRYLGGGDVILCDRPGTKTLTPERYESLRALLVIQPYITSVTREIPGQGPKPDWDFTGFRAYWGRGRTLTDKVAACAGIAPEAVDTTTPWITIPHVEKHKKIVLNRSVRNLGHLHWFRFWGLKCADCIFLGLREDYDNFCFNNFPYNNHNHARPYVEFVETKDGLEAAKLIAGSRLFVCNQSFLFWVAEGMKHPHIIQEWTCEDSTFVRLGVKHVRSRQDNLTEKEILAL